MSLFFSLHGRLFRTVGSLTKTDTTLQLVDSMMYVQSTTSP